MSSVANDYETWRKQISPIVNIIYISILIVALCFMIFGRWDFTIVTLLIAPALPVMLFGYAGSTANKTHTITGKPQALIGVKSTNIAEQEMSPEQFKYVVPLILLLFYAPLAFVVLYSIFKVSTDVILAIIIIPCWIYFITVEVSYLWRTLFTTFSS